MFSLNKLSSKLPYLCRPKCNRTLTLSPSNWSSIKKASKFSVAPTKVVSGNPVKFTTSEANLGYKATLNFSGDDRNLPSSHNLVLATSVSSSFNCGGCVARLSARRHEINNTTTTLFAAKPLNLLNCQSIRGFHANNSKVNYLDFRHRFRVNGLKLHMLIIRRQKMKKHRRQKFRRKFKALLTKQRFKREIAKEKAFRVELLTMIRLAEKFDPKEYAMRKINEINSKPKEKTEQEKLEELKELIRQNRYQVDYVKPKHRRADI